MTNATEKAISITTEARPDSQLAATIAVTATRSQQVYNQVLNDLVRNTQVPGFRKGKAPKQLLLKQIGTDRLRYVVLEKLIEDTVQEAVRQEQIPYLGNLKLEGNFLDALEAFDPQQPFRFSVTFDVKPEVTISNYQGLTIEYTPTTYDPEDVEKVLQRYQRDYATLIPVEDRPAQWGDEVTVKIVTTQNDTGEVLPKLSSEELPLSLDEEQPFLLPEIAPAVVGMAIGETKQVPIVTPGESERESEEPDAVSEIELLEIKAPELPPLDDAFAAEHSEFSTMAELRAHLEQVYQQQVQNQEEVAKQAALIDVLLANNEVVVPVTLVTQEAENEVKLTLNRLQSQGLDMSKFMTKELYEKMVAEQKPTATKKVQTSVLIAQIAQQEGITPTEAEIAEEVKGYIEAFGRANAKQRQLLEEVARTELIRQQTLAWLIERNQFQPKPPAADPETTETNDSDVADSAVTPTAEQTASTEPEEPTAKPKKRAGKKAASPPAAE